MRTTSHPLCTVVILACVLTLVATGLQAESPEASSSVSVSSAAVPVTYVAQRWLYAVSPKLRSDGWMEVRTSYEAARGFRYEVLAEGGSERIRERALMAVLKAEQKLASPAAARLSAFTADNYAISELPSKNGFRRVRLVPLRRDQTLVDGEGVLDEHGCLKTVRGKLAKSPSFWVKWVTMVREYACVNGTSVPVRVESTADVRFAGVSRLLMTYEYESINGRPVQVRTAERQLGPALLPASMNAGFTGQ